MLGDEVWWTRTAPTEGGRTTIVHGAPTARTRAAARAVERPDPGPRVRRAVLPAGPRRGRRVHQLRRPAALPAGTRRRAPAAHPRARAPSRAALRGLDRPRRADLVRPGAAPPPTAGYAGRSSPSRWHGPRPSHRERVSGQRLLRLPHALPRRRATWPGSAGTTRACRGTAPSCASPRLIRRQSSSDGQGRLRESVLAPLWRDERAPVRLISDWPGWWNLYQVGAARRVVPGALPGGGGVRRAAVAARRPAVRACWATGGSRSCTGRATCGWACSTRRRGELSRPGRALHRLGAGAVRRRARPGRDRRAARRCPAPIVRVDTVDRAGGGAAPRASTSCPTPPTCRAARRGARGPVRPPGARLRLPARQPGGAGARGRAAAVRRVRARRPHRARAPACSTWRRPTSPAAASASSTSTTAARPATAAPTASGCAASGASWTWRTRSPPPRRWPTSGEADPARLAIRGGSAGGWTVHGGRCASERCSPAATSYYGVARLAAPFNEHPRLRVALPRTG